MDNVYSNSISDISKSNMLKKSKENSPTVCSNIYENRFKLVICSLLILGMTSIFAIVLVLWVFQKSTNSAISPSEFRAIPRKTCYMDAGYDYIGTVSKDSSGKHCWTWNNDQLLGGGNFLDKKRKDIITSIKAVDGKDYHNYCRNTPVLGFKQPVCYVGPNKPSNCSITSCKDIDDYIRPTVLCYRDKGQNYTGEKTRTVSNKTCLAWGAKSVRNHYQYSTSTEAFERYIETHNELLNKDPTPRIEDDKPLVNHNFCRNPKGTMMKPWCYVNEGSSIIQELCNVPKCSEACLLKPPICQNDGTCYNHAFDFYCDCDAKWTGQTCTKDATMATTKSSTSDPLEITDTTITIISVIAGLVVLIVIIIAVVYCLKDLSCSCCRRRRNNDSFDKASSPRTAPDMNGIVRDSTLKHSVNRAQQIPTDVPTVPTRPQYCNRHGKRTSKCTASCASPSDYGGSHTLTFTSVDSRSINNGYTSSNPALRPYRHSAQRNTSTHGSMHRRPLPDLPTQRRMYNSGGGGGHFNEGTARHSRSSINFQNEPRRSFGVERVQSSRTGNRRTELADPIVNRSGSNSNLGGYNPSPLGRYYPNDRGYTDPRDFERRRRSMRANYSEYDARRYPAPYNSRVSNRSIGAGRRSYYDNRVFDDYMGDVGL